jgi:hypothetical protein
MAITWDQFYKTWRLDNFQNGRTLSTAAQWKFLAAGDGVLECHWEAISGETQWAQIVNPQSLVKEVLAKLHGGPLGGHLGVSKTGRGYTMVLLVTDEE